MLQADAIEVRVGERVLVRALDLAIGAGERWAVLGRNGAGKSTLLYSPACAHRMPAG